jgi:hypothetical protein
VGHRFVIIGPREHGLGLKTLPLHDRVQQLRVGGGRLNGSDVEIPFSTSVRIRQSVAMRSLVVVACRLPSNSPRTMLVLPMSTASSIG